MYQTKTKEQLADEYGINRRTLYNWLKKYNIHTSKGLLKPCELEEIYSKIGKPPEQ